jgi:mono/diheme cytochrome c family protein
MKFLTTYALPACLTALLLAVPGRADSCHAVRSTGTYVGATYVAPTYSGHGYGHDVYPYAIPVAIIPSQFYSVEPTLAYAAIVQAAADAAAAKTRLSPADLEYAVKKALADMLQPQRPPAAPPKDDPGLGPPIQAIPPATSVGNPSGGQTARAAVQKLVGARCVSCHRPGDQSPDLTGDPSKWDEILVGRMLKRIMTDGKGRMPPKGPSVEGADLEAFNLLSFEVEAKSK